jgi:PAS domain S-box-containing protein
VLVSLKRKKPQITKRVFASGAATLDLAKRLARVSHEKKPRISKRVSGLPVIGLLTLVYFIVGKFGLMLASLHASASPVWPPAGIALAALLVLGYRAWPAIFVGAFLVNVTTAGNVATSLAVASGNTLEAVCGAWLVNRFAGGTTVFDRPQGVFKFALAAMVSTIISPAFGVTSLALAGSADWTNYGAIWLTWWLGDTTGDLLIAPLIILWSIASKRRWNRREAVEVGILLLLLFVLSEAVFGGWLTISAKDYPIAFICGAIVIWTAFRFTQRETATGIFILSAIAIWGTLHGFGPFVGETENQSLLALQSWTAVLTVTAMALSAGMAERGRAEEALRESEARINLAANAANLGLWLWKIPGDELWVTEEWRKMFGFADSKPVTFDRLLDIVHPGDRERMKKIVRQMFEHDGGEYENEYRITRPDGSVRWMAGYGGVELDERGKPAFARGVSRDITARKLAEEKFQLVLDAAPNAMIMVDSAGVITFANASATTVFGYSLSELIGRHIETLIPERFRDLHVGYRNGFLSEPSSRAMGSGRDLFGRRKDGNEFPVEVGLNPIHTTEGLFVLASVIDITARKQAELEHQLQNMELARVGRVAVMGELAASLAHEVNNPIAAIVTNARAAERSIAAGKIGTEELSELLADIVADGRRAGEVIQGIRNMVRKGKPRRALIQIGDTIRELLRIVHADAIGREIEVTAEVDSDTGQVWGDAVQILQVLLNLATNSFEAMTAVPSDARRLAIHAGCDGNGDILVSMRDSGPGFPSGMVEQLFEPFFSTKAEGTGMGLAIARGIVEAHGGTLSGENCDDGGACFTVHLPRSKEDNSQAA